MNGAPSFLECKEKHMKKNRAVTDSVLSVTYKTAG